MDGFYPDQPATPKYTVLVTGGNGFLGQHIVKLLHEQADFVTHIRVLDIRTFSKQLDYTERKPVATSTGDITDESVLEGATRGVDCVVHVASVVDARTFPDEDLMYKVNVIGTEKLLEVSIRENVGTFVYCSSESVVMGYDDLIDCTEEQAIPSKFLFGTYAATKRMVEVAVEKHDGSGLSDGNLMRTMIIRPIIMYGELDEHWASHLLRWANFSGGTLLQVAIDKNTVNQAAYVGNVAWGFVCAVKALKENRDLGGETFFICDDTPVGNVYQMCKPFLDSNGFKVSSFVLPLWLVYMLVAMFTCVAYVIYPFYKMNSNLTFSSVRYTASMRISVVYTKARKMLNYKPLFTHEESLRMSEKFYTQPCILK